MLTVKKRWGNTPLVVGLLVRWQGRMLLVHEERVPSQPHSRTTAPSGWDDTVLSWLEQSCDVGTVVSERASTGEAWEISIEHLRLHAEEIEYRGRTRLFTPLECWTPRAYIPAWLPPEEVIL